MTDARSKAATAPPPARSGDAGMSDCAARTTAYRRIRSHRARRPRQAERTPPPNSPTAPAATAATASRAIAAAGVSAGTLVRALARSAGVPVRSAVARGSGISFRAEPSALLRPSLSVVCCRCRPAAALLRVTTCPATRVSPAADLRVALTLFLCGAVSRATCPRELSVAPACTRPCAESPAAFPPFTGPVAAPERASPPPARSPLFATCPTAMRSGSLLPAAPSPAPPCAASPTSPHARSRCPKRSRSAWSLL